MFPVMVMLLLLLIGTTAERDTPTFIYNNGTGFGFSMCECRLHITDDLKNPLSCVKNQTACYVSCSEGGDFNFTSNSSELTVEGNQACDKFYIAGANTTCKLVPCTTDEIKEVLQPLNNPAANLNELKTLLNVKQMCNNLFDDFQFVDFYIGVEERIIHNVIRDMSLANVSLDFDLDDLVMTVTGVNCSRQDRFINVTSPTSVPGYTPVETLIPVEALINTPAEKQKAAVVRYRSSQQFLVGQDIKLVSTVVRVEVLEPVKQLKTPLRMSFAVNWTDFSPVQNQKFSCQFYNHSALQDDSRWSSDGCSVNTVNESHNNTTVECSCDHMTPFAVLLIPGLEGTLDPLHWTILSYISYIGCGLSALFSAIAILSYFIIRKVRADATAGIHASLSGALLLLNSSFLLSQWAAASQNPPALCVCVAVAIEYGLLSAFSWMAIEALHLYLMLVRVFNTYYTRYLLKLSLIGWGVPAALIILSLVVRVENDAFYGLVSSQDVQFCWITDQVFAYGMNLTFFSLVFLLNSGILIAVSGRILRLQGRRRGTPSPSPSPSATTPGLSCRNLLTVLGLTCLLGSTWGLAFLSLSYANHAILYLFCILNSLQGFFLFLWVCGTSRKETQEKKKKAHTHTHTLGTKTGVLDSFSYSRSAEEFFPGGKLSS